MNYEEIISEESTNMFDQYFSEYKNEVIHHNKTDFKEHVKELELELVAWKLFEYHEVDLLKHFALSFISKEYSDKKDTLVKQFEHDLVEKLKNMYQEQILNMIAEVDHFIRQQQEDKTYYEERKYIQDASMKSELPIREEKRHSYMEQCEKEIKEAQEKRNVYELALNSMV